MKALLVTDLHFGARSDNSQFDSFFESFYSEVFFPFLDSSGINNVFILGDVFDRRKYINFNILKNCKRYFFDQLESRGVAVKIIAGNHDVYFKNTNEVNSLELLLCEYNNIEIFTTSTEISFDDQRILLVPWITVDNVDNTMNMLKNTSAAVCFGHFEISGFEMHRGEVIEHGLNPELFKGFDLVCSGHFHHRSQKGNITYLGNPYEITWSDYDDTRGFHVFDSNDLTLEFIPNPFRMFHKITYDDTKPIDMNLDKYSKKYVKLLVVNKTDYYKFDQYLDRLYSVNPYELKILEDFDEFTTADVDESVDVEDTMSLLGHYVDAIATDMDKSKIKSTLKSLYVEAQAAEKE